MKVTLVAAFLLGLGGAVAYWLSTRGAETGLAPMSQPTDTRPDTRPAESRRAAPIVRSVVAVKSAPTPPAGSVLSLPDGTFLPALNGVRSVPTTSWWPGDRPWSPVVRKETYADGSEWYVHADGSKSTTKMVWRSDLGREDGTVQVDNPVPVLPILPGGR
jgi:hypothetical protein